MIMRIKRKAFICTLLMVLSCLSGVLLPEHRQTVEAAGTYSVYLEGKCHYDYAQDVLDVVNKERKKAGAEALAMDKELLQAAMLRAAEIALVYDHTRPNGKRCFTASNRMYGENIAIGQRSPKEVMEDWMQSSGHRMNILQEGYCSVGIGVFYHEGHYYWVQCFGYDQAEQIQKTGVEKKTCKISVKRKLSYKISGKKKLTMKKGGTKTLSLKVDNFFTATLLAKSGKWSSSKPSVVTVSKKGKLTAKKKGTAVISCKLGGVTKKITVKVK